MKFRISSFRFLGSLRSRFAFGMGAVLLPFLMAAAMGQFYLLPRLIEPFDDIVRELTEEMEPIMRLQMTLLQASMPINDYLIHGDQDERRQFAKLHQRVERAFKKASPERFTLPEERALIEHAHEEWEQALRLGEQLLRLPAPVGNAAARDMEQFDAHIDQAVSALDEMSDLFYQVIGQNRAQAEAARIRAQRVVFAAFVLATAVSLFAGVSLARAVTSPVDRLRQGAARLAEGKLSYRVDIHGDDELGELAAAFNAMAEKLEKNDAALQELATHDGLTGLYNHRAFYVLLEDEIARAQRSKQPVSLLLLDIDHFKRVNDTHGHQAGDAVLKGLGELLRRETRAIDRTCRYGGEEITVILPNTDFETAASAAERLRAAAEAHPFDVNTGAPLRITVSIGVASWPVHADNALMLVAAADLALYAAKQNGRNLVILYETTLGQPTTKG